MDQPSKKFTRGMVTCRSLEMRFFISSAVSESIPMLLRETVSSISCKGICKEFEICIFKYSTKAGCLSCFFKLNRVNRSNVDPALSLASALLREPTLRSSIDGTKISLGRGLALVPTLRVLVAFFSPTAVLPALPLDESLDRGTIVGEPSGQHRLRCQGYDGQRTNDCGCRKNLFQRMSWRTERRARQFSKLFFSVLLRA